MSECKDHELTGSIDCMERHCRQSYIGDDLKEAWERAEKAEARVKELEEMLFPFYLHAKAQFEEREQER